MNSRRAGQEVDIQFSELRERKPEELKDGEDFEIIFTRAKEDIKDDFELTLNSGNLDDVDIDFDVSQDEISAARAEQDKLNQQAQQIVVSWRREADEVAEQIPVETDQPEIVENIQVESASDLKRRNLELKIDQLHKAIADLRPDAERKIIQAEKGSGLTRETLDSLSQYKKQVEELNVLRAELAKLDGKELPTDVIDEDSELLERISALEKQPLNANTEKGTETIEQPLEDQLTESEIRSELESDGFSPEMVRKEIEMSQEIRTRVNSLLNDKEINNFYLRSAFENGTRLKKYIVVLDRYIGLLSEYQLLGKDDSKEELKSKIFAEKNLLKEWHNFYMELGSEIINTNYSTESTNIGARLKNIARAAHEVLDRRYW